MDGIQPQAVHAQPGQVVKPAREPGEITDTVAVGVLERLDVQAVDDCLLIPALGHVAPLSPWRPWQNASAVYRLVRPHRAGEVRGHARRADPRLAGWHAQRVPTTAAAAPSQAQ